MSAVKYSQGSYTASDKTVMFYQTFLKTAIIGGFVAATKFSLMLYE
jgi:hypothetical protein